MKQNERVFNPYERIKELERDRDRYATRLSWAMLTAAFLLFVVLFLAVKVL